MITGLWRWILQKDFSEPYSHPLTTCIILTLRTIQIMISKPTILSATYRCQFPLRQSVFYISYHSFSSYFQLWTLRQDLFRTELNMLICVQHLTCYVTISAICIRCCYYVQYFLSLLTAGSVHQHRNKHQKSNMIRQSMETCSH